MIELDSPHEEFRMFVTTPKNWLLARSKGVVGLLLPLASLVISNSAITDNLADTASDSMLLIFVPRKCGDGVCTVQQNLVTDDMFNKAALGFNYASIGFFLLTYLIELRRENFCVHNFDIDHDVGDNNLAIILKEKPKLLDSLHYHNRLYSNITKATFFVYLINFILLSSNSLLSLVVTNKIILTSFL